MSVLGGDLEIVEVTETGNEFLSVNPEEDDGELKVGMRVYSEEEAYNLYNESAIRKDFSVRRAHIRHGKGDMMLQRNYLCWKEGFRQDGDPCEMKKVYRLDTRTGYKASVQFSITRGMWEITHFVSEHNHELVNPEQRHLLKSNHNIPDAHKGIISSMIKAGIKLVKKCSYMVKEVGGIEKQAEDYARSRDAQSMINHFKHKQAEDPMFFYSVQVNHENRMTSFFWQDGRSKIDYDCFGDAIAFGTTFRTNKYNMIYAPFVGINHHWKNVLLGCAFLMDETEKSFTWLFQTFMESTGSR